MSSYITLRTIGKFGNQMFVYAFGRAYAEKYGAKLETDDWIGRRIFENINEPLISHDFPQKADTNIEFGEVNVEIRGYCQQQKCLLYTRKQLKEWFVFKPSIKKILDKYVKKSSVVAHRRVGDYLGYGYCVVSEESYYKACDKFGIDKKELIFVTEENPIRIPELEQQGLGFLGDFYKLMLADVILRGNSTFSWWAAVLSDAKHIYSPIIEGMPPGVRNVEFVEGNYPKNLDGYSFLTDLHMERYEKIY